jgi:hypothetical protein
MDPFHIDPCWFQECWYSDDGDETNTETGTKTPRTSSIARGSSTKRVVILLVLIAALPTLSYLGFRAATAPVTVGSAAALRAG